MDDPRVHGNGPPAPRRLPPSPGSRQEPTTPEVSVVVPLKDEAESLTPLYEEVAAVLAAGGRPFEILFVDDGSADRSPEVLRSLARRDPRVRVLRLRRHFGKAAALSVGLERARGAAVVTIDADLQDDPTAIPALLRRLDEGWDLVSGWKRQRRDPLRRRLASRVFNWATRTVSGLRLHDFNCGLKAYTRECARELAPSTYGELHRYLPYLAHARGFRVTELPVEHRERANGRSRYGLERYVRGFLDLLTAAFLSRYARRPMHVFGALGLLLFLPGTGILGYLVLDKVILGSSIGGRPLLVLGAVMAITGLQLMLTGLLAEMLSAPRRPGVPFQEIVDVSDERVGADAVTPAGR